MELKQWLNIPAYTRCEAYQKPKTCCIRNRLEKVRFEKLDDRTGFVFFKGCTRTGRYISAEQILKEFILIEKNEEVAWQKKIKRAKNS